MSYTIGGVTLDMGVEKDTGWIQEEVIHELHPVGSNSTVLQSNGFNSAKRKIEGVTKSSSVKSGLDNLYSSRNTFTITDHRGVSSSARFIRPIDWDEKQDVTNLGTGTFTFRIEFIKR